MPRFQITPISIVGFCNGLLGKEKFGGQLFCTILWKIWFARNQLIFKKVAANPVQIGSNALEFANPGYSPYWLNRPVGEPENRTLSGNHIYVDVGASVVW